MRVQYFISKYLKMREMFSTGSKEALAENNRSGIEMMTSRTAQETRRKLIKELFQIKRLHFNDFFNNILHFSTILK